jgi:SAM-dependent methyltransferase
MKPKLYHELSEWYPLLTPVEDYREEAGYFLEAIAEFSSIRGGTLLELGSGAGHNAFYLKKNFRLTLTDLSEEMLALSRKLNPECEHVAGDMRELRLHRLFDVVFIHDAITYLLTREDLKKVFATAAVHCRPGGVIVVAPDYVKENYSPVTEHGGTDGDGRSMRYLEWDSGPDADGTYLVDFVLVLRRGNDLPEIVHDRHRWGLFSEAEWLAQLEAAGFAPLAVNSTFGTRVFLGRKQG